MDILFKSDLHLYPKSLWLQVKKARAQSAKPKEQAHVDSEAAVGSEFPVFVWWTMDPAFDSEVLLSSHELTRYSKSSILVSIFDHSLLP